MSESSLSTRWWNQTRLQRATEKTYLSQLAAAQVQPNLKMRTADIRHRTKKIADVAKARKQARISDSEAGTA
jgi:hypothetical protein